MCVASMGPFIMFVGDELAKIREHLIEVCGKLPEEAPPQASLQYPLQWRKQIT